MTAGIKTGSRGGKGSAFTLVELVVATAIFLILIVVLASISNQAATVWSRSESKSDLREAARAAISRMSSEMKQAALPLYKKDQKSLQFVINPSDISADYKHRDAVFWQAPIATSRDRGDLAIVGYFIRKEGKVPKLCRLYVNPSDAAYKLHDGTGAWLDDGLLDLKAPGTEDSHLQGVFLENVPGMWVTAYSDASTPYASYDSRVAGKLPARVEISLALLDKKGAERVASGAAALPEAGACADAAAFMSQLPANIRAHVQNVTISVSFPL
jgi:type II secretory pathway component PulJ